MKLRFDLGDYLRRQNLTTLQLVREVRGEVAPSTVYGLARRTTRRLDLNIIGKLLQGLSRLKGRKVVLSELLHKSSAD